MTKDYARYDKIQRLNRYQHPTPKPRSLLAPLILTAVLFLVMIVKNHRPQPVPHRPTAPCSQCHNRHAATAQYKAAMRDYFQRAGATAPDKMAEAVLATKQPRLLAAVHVAGEKCTPYTVRRGGYRHRHAGAWQVNSRYWGRVPIDPVAQALQSEKILAELTGELGVKRGLSVYGGDHTDKYANAVLAELSEVP